MTQKSPRNDRLESISHMTGTKRDSIQRALNTYENDVGPGQYDQPSSPLTGARLNVSKFKNAGKFSVG